MRNRKIGRKPDRKIPVPKNGDELIVLTGLVHVETGRQFAFCTQEGAEGFFLSPEDMARPDGCDDRVARCKYCKVEGTEEAETHWIVDFRTALAEGRVDTENGDHVISGSFAHQRTWSKSRGRTRGDPGLGSEGGDVMKSRKKIGKPDVRFWTEVELRVHRIVRLGLEHIKAGRSLGRLCICTSDQNGETFFIGLKETGARRLSALRYEAQDRELQDRGFATITWTSSGAPTPLTPWFSSKVSSGPRVLGSWRSEAR